MSAAPTAKAPAPLLLPGLSGPQVGAWHGAEVSALVSGPAGDRIERVRLARVPGWDQAELAIQGEGAPEAHEVVALVPGLPVGPVVGFGLAPGALLAGEAQRVATTVEGVWVVRVDDALAMHLELHALDEDGLPERAASHSQALGGADSHERPPALEWVGDLDGDGALDLIIELSPNLGGPRKRRLLTGASAAEGDLVGVFAEGDAGGC